MDIPSYSAPQPAPVMQPMHHGMPKAAVALIAVVVLAGAYVALASWQSLWPFATPTASPTPIASVTPEGVTGWKVYRAPTYTVRYPQSWVTNSSNAQDDVHISSRIFTDNREQDSGITTIEIQTFGTKPVNMDILSFAKSKIINGSDGVGFPSGAVTEVTLNGLRAIKIEHSGGEGPDGPVYYIESTPTSYVAILVYLGSSTDSSTIGQILSTFTFTNPNATAGWKTYTNTQYGFVFKYPNDFIVAATKTIGTVIGSDLLIHKASDNGYVFNGLSVSDVASSPEVDGNAPFASVFTEHLTRIRFTLNGKTLYAQCSEGAANITLCNQMLSTFRFTK